jgi:chemotaxis protein methyltransferase CheR
MPEQNDQVLQFFAKYIESQLGIIYAEANYFQLAHRLKDITATLGLKDLQELYAKAQAGITGEMKNLILDLATNNETSFFRDPKLFEALREFIIPELHKSGKSHLSIWSAASSSGQEAYSIAMVLAEYMEKSPTSSFTYSMLLSDVSDTILKRARAGLYTQLEVQRGLTEGRQSKFFDHLGGDQWKVKDKLQQGMEFRKINLLGDWGFVGSFDLVFIRNVLIYQGVENKKKIIKNILDRLNPGGFMILGAAESLFGLSDGFKQVAHNGVIIFQKLPAINN